MYKFSTGIPSIFDECFINLYIFVHVLSRADYEKLKKKYFTSLSRHNIFYSSLAFLKAYFVYFPSVKHIKVFRVQREWWLTYGEGRKY